ncbi:MAG: acyl-CoA dehydrogenase family protein [Desulfatibacillaceae bacterium]|nr:acyl-CoA dehydrogenase family protein [Desulfatibacillaceae bacterium]
MEYSLTFEETQVVQSTARFALNDILPLQKQLDSTGIMPDGLKQKFLELGILRLPFPEQYGGLDATFTAMMLAVRELGYASPVPPNGILENFVLAWPILNFGSAAMKERYLPGLIAMETVGGLAFTEPDTGSDPRQLITIAKKTDGGWILNGTKRFITYSGICDYLILFAKTEQNQVAAFLVESARPGYKVGRRESFVHMALDNGDIYLEDYFAPDEHLIGTVEQGFEVLLKSESLGKIGFCAIFIGAAKRALDLAISYANTKMHRDKPIGIKFPMIQEKIARMATQIEAMDSYLLKVCAKADKGGDIFWEAAVLKLMTAEGMRTVATDAMEIHGAYGLSQEYEVGRFYAMAAAVPVVMGSMDIQRVITGRTLLAKGKYSD